MRQGETTASSLRASLRDRREAGAARRAPALPPGSTEQIPVARSHTFRGGTKYWPGPYGCSQWAGMRTPRGASGACTVRSGTQTGPGEAAGGGGSEGPGCVARPLTWSIARDVEVPPPPSWATSSSAPHRVHPRRPGGRSRQFQSPHDFRLASRPHEGKTSPVLTYNRGAMSETPLVAVIMGSKSDWETMRHADEMLTRFGVPHECRIVSAHRTPDWMARVRQRRRGARARGDHRRGGRGRAPAGHGGRPDAAAGARRAGREPRAQGPRLAALDRADARRRAGRHAGHRQGRGDQRGPAGRPPSLGHSRPELREKLREFREEQTRRVPRETRCREPHRRSCPARPIGVLGSGQLGRMFAIAARRMGYRVHTFSPD